MRRTPIRSRQAEREALRRAEPGYQEWKRSSFGRCQSCGEPGPLLKHHVVLEQHLRAAGHDPWDPRVAMLLGFWCPCHRQHHSGYRRLALSMIPAAAIELTVELYGASSADVYLERYYRAS